MSGKKLVDGQAGPDQKREAVSVYARVLNSSRRHTETTYVPEESIDKSMDLVFWGHEHDCQVRTCTIHIDLSLT